MAQQRPDKHEQYDEGQQERRPRRRKSNAGKIFFWVAVVLLSATFLSFFIIQTANDIFGFKKYNNQIEITITQGMGVGDVANLLARQGVIKQSSTFHMYARIKNNNGVLQAGDYILNSNMSYDQIILALRTGNTIKDEVTITFFEGLSAAQMAKMLEEKKVCSAKDFLERLETIELGFEFEEMIPENPLRFRRLEGYLFPDTYDFYVNENVDSVIKKFLRNFQNRVFPELYEKIRDAGMTLDEAVTLASVIQKEASVKEEMYIVSSVFHNRIENQSAGLPRLQSDVTIFYVEENIKPYQTRTTQDIYDAYNTYVCEGLPVGPICSPGVLAIEAAVKPQKTEYYFFVTDKTGKYYYSKTLPEHNRNVRIADSVGGTHGTGVAK